MRRQIKVSLVPRRTSPLKISRRLGREVVTCKAQCSFRFFPLPPLLFFSFRGRSRFVLVFQSVYQTIENEIKSRARFSHCKALSGGSWDSFDKVVPLLPHCILAWTRLYKLFQIFKNQCSYTLHTLSRVHEMSFFHPRYRFQRIWPLWFISYCLDQIFLSSVLARLGHRCGIDLATPTGWESQGYPLWGSTLCKTLSTGL